MEQQLTSNTSWFESPRVRLSNWRSFRKGLDTNNVYDVCRTVLEWWKMAPLSARTIDPVHSNTWPTPWEMLHSGEYCEDSLALGMGYTVYYANSSIDNELLYIYDKQKSIHRLCCLVDKKYLLNYSYGEISKLPADVHVSYSKKIADVIS